jgi:hypothetical protein
MAKAASVLLVLLLGLAMATGADARHRRHHHFGDTGSSGPPTTAPTPPVPALPAPALRTGAFGAVIVRLIRGCAQQADELAHLPLDAIAQIVAPDETQRGALDALRSAAAAAAQRLSSDCPQDVPAAPSAQLEAVDQGIDAALAAFAGVQPALEQLYAALDDEQKARLLRDMTLRGAPAAPADSAAHAQAQLEARSRERWSERLDRWQRRADRRRAYAESGRAEESVSTRAADSVRSPPPCGEGLGVGVARSRHRHYPTSLNTRPDCGARRVTASANLWAGACEDLAAALRGWPIREIERDVRLTEPQRIAFYELVTASLKAADTLASACPAERALTAAGRMAALRARLAAVKAATAAIRPALARFYDALDQGQQARFAGMS